MKTLKKEIARKEVTRFDARIPKEQKHIFEKAAALGGYRNLTNFIIVAAQDRANQIISQQEQILASSRDSEIFFDAILNPAPPNTALLKAAQKYKELYLK